MTRQSLPRLSAVAAAAGLLAGATTLTPAGAQEGELDGDWVVEGAVATCDEPRFRIEGDTLTFAGGEPWAIADDGLLLTVTPPEDCTECERAPFDIMPDGSLQRFVEGTVERFVNCAATPELDIEAEAPEPDQEPATETWENRDPSQGAEAFFSTGETTTVVGCRPGPATVYIRYYPRDRFEFPSVNTPRGTVNLVIGTEHPQFGAYFSAHEFDPGSEGARVFYEGTWSSADPFFMREKAFRLIAAFRTGVEMTVQSATVVAGSPEERQYEDVFTLAGSTSAIDGAMQAGGCAGFLAATEQAIRSGRYE